MNFRLVFIFQLLIFIGCGAAVTDNPIAEVQPTIAADKMQPILSDIHLAEGLLATVADKIERDKLAKAYYGQILAKHKVSTVDFEQSMQAYFRSPTKLAALYEKVLADLQQKEAQ